MLQLVFAVRAVIETTFVHDIFTVKPDFAGLLLLKHG